MASQLTLETVKELLQVNSRGNLPSKKTPAFGVEVPLFYGKGNVQMNNFDQVYPSIYLGNV